MGLSRNHFQLNSGRSPVRSRLRSFSSRRFNSPVYDLDWPVPVETDNRSRCGRSLVRCGLTSAWRCPCQAFWVAAGCVAFGSGSMCRWRRSAVVRIPAFRAGDRDGRNAATRGRNGIRNAVSGATRRRPRRRAGRRRQTWHRRWCPITEVVQIVAGLSQAARDGARQRGSILDYRCR